MPLYGGIGNLLIQQPDLAEQIMRALGLKGRLPGVLEQRFEPSINVLDLMHPVYAPLRRCNYYSQFANVPAGGAGNFSQAALGLPAGFNARVLAHVYRLFVANTGAANTFADVGISGSANVSPTLFGIAQDDRSASGGVLSNSQYQVGSTSIVANNPLSSGGVKIFLTPGQSLMFDCAFTLSGAGAGASKLYVVNDNANAAIAATFFWFERSLLASEIT